jgi:hypothetical protein
MSIEFDEKMENCRRNVKASFAKGMGTLNADVSQKPTTNSAMPKPHRAVCSHCYGSKEMCDNCDNGSRFYPLCRADGVASA